MSRAPFSDPRAGASIAFALSTLAALAGCSQAEGPSPAEGPTYVRDIQPLLQIKCVGCHSEGGIAPFSLDGYDAVSAEKSAVRSAVADRRMPPWMPADGCADYLGDRSLTDDQIDTLVRWIDEGAAPGDPGEAPAEVPDTRLLLSRVDFDLPMPEPYVPQILPDDYRCFFLDWPAKETTYVTGLGVVAQNASIVHHVIAYAVPPDELSTFQSLDDAEPGPGWTCFGGPGGSGPGQASWLGGWVPGATGQDYPAGTGIQVATGSKIILQVHYNSRTDSPAADKTRILVRTDASVEKRAAFMPFADPKWVTTDAMKIPAHSKDFVRSFTHDPTTLVDLLTAGSLPNDAPLTVHGAGLHLHTLGRRAEARIERADGGAECMLDIPQWDFHWQGDYTFAAPKHIAPGDRITLECQWDNPGAQDVIWGEGTSDEMCLGLFYVTE